MTTHDRAGFTVAMLGNPNTGKSTLFNGLAGVHQRVGNYPGVTVEKRVGQARFGRHRLTLIDLPGTYSLAPQSPDEMVAVDVLLGRQSDVAIPDVILCIVDAGNLERNLYLVSQALELERPVVVALNMMDLANQRGVQVDVPQLADRLQVPVIPLQAHRKIGLEALKQALLEAVSGQTPKESTPFPEAFRDEVMRLHQWLQDRFGQRVPRYLVKRLLLDTDGYVSRTKQWRGDGDLRRYLREARERLAAAGVQVPAIETTRRYQWVDGILNGIVTRPVQVGSTVTDHIDRLLTNRIVGTVVFLALMALVFQAIFTWTTPVNELIQRAEAGLGDWVTATLSPGMLRSLLVNGVIAGVGAVLAFLPQIATLFFFIAVLEDCGYMSRAAYLMDGLMARVGLSGKSFIPLVSSFACAVPGIMAARVIEDRRDRLVTILVAPLMSCSARLPVYILLISAFIPHRPLLGRWLGLQSATIIVLYGLGILVAIVVASLLKRTLLKGETPPFIMELPDYRVPLPRVVLARVLEQCRTFVRNAGTLILAVTVLVWAAAYFPHPNGLETRMRAEFSTEAAALDSQIKALEMLDRTGGTQSASKSDASGSRRLLDDLKGQQATLESTISNRIAGAYMEQSFLGRLGKLIAPIVRPLGWDWRIGCAVIASFPAREVVIGAMGVIYNLGDGQDEHSVSLSEHLRRETWPGTNRPVFTVPVALSVMVFFALCAQCAATLIMIRRETGKWRWALFTFVYMTALAYLGALMTYQIGTRILG